MFGGVEIIQVGELVAQRVAEHAVGLGHLADALFTDHDVVAEVLRGNPEAHHVRAVFLDVGLGSLRLLVAALPLFALGDFFAVGVHHESVREHGPERRRPLPARDSRSEDWNQPRCWSLPSRYMSPETASRGRAALRAGR